jgi:hypothetical protein
MKNELNISCPVSQERVNENVVRIIASIVVVITGVSIVTDNVFLSLLLVVDFSIRAFTTGGASPLRLIAKLIAQSLQLSNKPVDAAPKKFAAGLGAFFSLSIALFQSLAWGFAAKVTGLLLVSCAVLESGFAICLGCIIYSVLFSVKEKAGQ